MMRTRLFAEGQWVDAQHMDYATCKQQLGTVQGEIEALLAGRSIGDLSFPEGYRPLVLLESALVKRRCRLLPTA